MSIVQLSSPIIEWISDKFFQNFCKYNEKKKDLKKNNVFHHPKLYSLIDHLPSSFGPQNLQTPTPSLDICPSLPTFSTSFLDSCWMMVFNEALFPCGFFSPFKPYVSSSVIHCWYKAGESSLYTLGNRTQSGLKNILCFHNLIKNNVQERRIMERRS